MPQSVWSPHTQKDNNKLEKVQRVADRFVKNDHRRTSSVTAMMADLHWKSLEHHRAYQQLTMFYKINHEIVNISIPPYIIPVSYRLYSIRNSHILKFTQLYCRTDIYAFSFYPRVIRMWNTLSPSIILSPSLTYFQSAIMAAPIRHATYIARF